MQREPVEARRPNELDAKINNRWTAAGKKIWSLQVPVRPTSMLLTGETLFAAGTPDVIDPDEPWAAYDGKRGGVLLAISAAEGEVLARYRLDDAPRFDGLAAAGGRLLLATNKGRILCYGDQ
ncbi:MAG: hypothetical protein V3R99_04040 [Thermoguttaceae bacterium]